MSYSQNKKIQIFNEKNFSKLFSVENIMEERAQKKGSGSVQSYVPKSPLL